MLAMTICCLVLGGLLFHLFICFICLSVLFDYLFYLFICFFCLQMQTGEWWGGHLFYLLYLFLQSFLSSHADWWEVRWLSVFSKFSQNLFWFEQDQSFPMWWGMSHKNCKVEFSETANNYMMIKSAPDSDCWPSWRWSQPRCWPQWRRRHCQGSPTKLIDQKSLRCFWKTWRRK